MSIFGFKEKELIGHAKEWGVNPDYYDQFVHDNLRDNRYELVDMAIRDGKKHPFAVICPGGAYACVCSFVEGLPFAQELNKNGISAFIVYYRVQDQAAFPNPQDDLAKAVREIFARAEELNLDTGHYSVWGSSAGGHLAASFGTTSMGYQKYGLPKPTAMVLCYPVVTMDAGLTHPETRENLLGKNPDPELVELTSVEKQVNGDYPPTFVFHGDADGAVPVDNSRNLKKALDAAGVDCKYIEYPGIEHGVGLARNLTCRDWFEEALAFLRKYGF